jgi:hypothetical protein
MEDHSGCTIRASVHTNHGMHQSESTSGRITVGIGMPVKSQQKASLRWDKKKQGEHKV